MLKTLTLSFLGGLLMTMFVTAVAAYVNAYTVPQSLSEVEVYVRYLYFALLLWFRVVAGIMLKNLNKIKLSATSLLLRQVLLWGPISIAWFFTTQGKDGVLVIGMIISSTVLCYEMQVWARAKPVR